MSVESAAATGWEMRSHARLSPRRIGQHECSTRHVSKMFAAIIVVAGSSNLLVPTTAAQGATLPPAGASSDTSIVGTTTPLPGPEYYFTVQSAGTWTATNSDTDLIVDVTPTGLQFKSTDPAAGPVPVGLALTRFGRSSSLSAVPSAAITASGPALIMARGAVTEWCANGPGSIEHGMTITSRPSGSGESMVLEFAITGPLHASVDDTGSVVQFRDDRNQTRVYYQELSAHDAVGSALTARMVISPRILQIEVDDSIATYPVTIDPVVMSTWGKKGTEPDGYFGYSLAIGDLNSDRVPDIVIGAPNFNTDGMIDPEEEGAVFVYQGIKGGLPSSAVKWKAKDGDGVPGVDGRLFGHALAVFDLGADGTNDLVIGAPGYDNGTLPDTGQAFIFKGKLMFVSNPSFTTSAQWQKTGAVAKGAFGTSVANGFNLGGSNANDLLIGAPGWNGGSGPTGAAFVFYGGVSNGLPATTEDATLVGPQSGGRFGQSVGTARDLNAMSPPFHFDVAVGEPGYDSGTYKDAGKVHVYYGPISAGTHSRA